MLADILTGTHPRKDLNKALERQLLFCQQSCNDKSLLMERRFDNTASYTREVVLQNHEALSSTALFNTSSMLQSTHIIDTLLPFLAIPDQTTKQLVKEEIVEVNETPAPVVLPAVMGQSGCVSVVFNEGLPTSVHSHTISAISIANNANNNNFPPSPSPLTTKDDNIDIKISSNHNAENNTELNNALINPVMHIPPTSTRPPRRFTPKPRKPPSSINPHPTNPNPTKPNPINPNLNPNPTNPNPNLEGTAPDPKKKVTFASILQSVQSSPAPNCKINSNYKSPSNSSKPLPGSPWVTLIFSSALKI